MAPSVVAPFFFLLPISLIIMCSFGANNNVRGDIDSDQVDFGVAMVEEFKDGDVCSELEALPPNSFKVVHRYGPCVDPFNRNNNIGQRPSDEDILLADQRRVAYLQNRVVHPDAPGNLDVIGADPPDLQASLESVTIPAMKGSLYDSDNYVVTVQLGARSTPQTVIFDTGSNVCWVQCMPCRSCYRQRQPVFNPRSSSSYRNVTCDATACTSLPAENRDCTADNICVYHSRYFGNSSSTGFLATDRLRLGQTTSTIEHFVFGCGHTNVGHFGTVAGLFGLSRRFHSLATQLASSGGRLGDTFFYCLPTVTNNIGYLGFGPRTAPPPARYTPMLNIRNYTGMYFVELLGISVGGERLQIPASVFQNVGTNIDSGTVITMLPPAAYAELRANFRRWMSRYHLTAPFFQLDTCYDDVHTEQFPYPKVTLHFNRVDLELKPPQVLIHINGTRFCLAFQAGPIGHMSVIGNTQQRGMELIYDRGQGRVGFSPGTNCR